MKKILVIGAGIFGVHISTKLASQGCDVTLVESASSILSKTSANSILRVHSGLHYPRDLDTAIQSQQGYSPFCDHYRDCIRKNFENYYGLSKVNSKSSKFDIEKIAKNAKIEIREVELEELKKYGMNTNLLNSAWSVEEGVVDLDLLKTFIESQFDKLNLNLMLNTSVSELILNKGTWIASAGEKRLGTFDYVIRATHGNDSIKSNVLEVSDQTYEFHLTSMIEIELNSIPFGMTVLDGDFISLLPSGFSDNFLLYGPGVSVLERMTGKNIPAHWKGLSKFRGPETIENTLQLLKFWFPDITGVKFVGMRNAVRAVQSNVKNSDRRVTQVVEVATNFVDIKSTKIDHVIEVGTYLSNLLNV